MTEAGAGVAVVTGAGGGLGARIAQMLAAAGQPVACVDVNPAAAAATAAGLAGQGYPVRHFGVDVTDADAVDDLRLRIVEELGPIRSLLNIAGILHRGNVSTTDPAIWRRTLEVNLTGPYLLIRAFADDLKTATDGRIINCSSISGQVGYPFAAYAASKAALSNLTRSSLFDFWGTDVTVNAICPGAMDTPMLDRSLVPVMIAKTPSGRVSAVDDVAAAAIFLNSPAARAINGVNLAVDGGATAVFSYTG